MNTLRSSRQFTLVTPSCDEEFTRYYDFRWRHLRAPWNEPPGSERDEKEIDSFHLMAIDENQVIIGVGRLHFNGKSEAQVRYMAVADEFQGQGVGEAILRKLEEIAVIQGADTVVLNAREPVAAFYQNRGYKTAGAAHTLFGQIPHVKMVKMIEKP